MSKVTFLGGPLLHALSMPTVTLSYGSECVSFSVDDSSLASYLLEALVCLLTVFLSALSSLRAGPEGFGLCILCPHTLYVLNTCLTNR